MPKRFPVRATALVLFAASLASCPSLEHGCQRGATPRDGAATLLAQLPAGTQTVLSVDFSRVRKTAVWSAFSTLSAGDPKDRQLIEQLTARTGLDPWTQVHRLLAAFPADARTRGEFGIIVDGEGFDVPRLRGWARDEAAGRGITLAERDHAGRQLLVGPSGTAGFFVDASRFVLGGGGWAERIADLLASASGSSGPPGSAADDASLVNLCQRAGAGTRMVWAAAVLPGELRTALRSDPRYEVASSVMRLGAGLDLGPGLTFELLAELSNEADAKALRERVDRLLVEARRDPKMLVLGMVHHLEGIKAVQEGANVRITANLDEARTTELIERLSALARLGRRGRPAAAPGDGGARR